MQDQRDWFHTRRLEETLNANSVMVQSYVAELEQRLSGRHAAIQLIGEQVQAQALVMTYSDIFLLMAVCSVAVLPLILLLRPLPQIDKPAMVHR